MWRFSNVGFQLSALLSSRDGCEPARAALDDARPLRDLVGGDPIQRDPARSARNVSRASVAAAQGTRSQRSFVSPDLEKGRKSHGRDAGAQTMRVIGCEDRAKADFKDGSFAPV